MSLNSIRKEISYKPTHANMNHSKFSVEKRDDSPGSQQYICYLILI